MPEEHQRDPEISAHFHAARSWPNQPSPYSFVSADAIADAAATYLDRHYPQASKFLSVNCSNGRASIDAHDRDEHGNELPDALLRLAVMVNGMILNNLIDEDAAEPGLDIQTQLTDPATFRAATVVGGAPIKLVPVRFRSKALALAYAACKQKDHADQDLLAGISRADVCEQLLQAAIACSWRTLAAIPRDHQTSDMCMTAVSQDGNAILFVDQRLRSAELYQRAVERSPEALRHVPDEHKTHWLCTLAIEGNGETLKHVPIAMRSKELCNAAVEQSGGAIRYVPPQLITAQMAQFAVEFNPELLDLVPPSVCTHSIYLAAVERRGSMIQRVPPSMRTLDVFAAALRRAPGAIKLVPPELRDHPTIAQALKQRKNP